MAVRVASAEEAFFGLGDHSRIRGAVQGTLDVMTIRFELDCLLMVFAQVEGYAAVRLGFELRSDIGRHCGSFTLRGLSRGEYLVDTAKI